MKKSIVFDFDGTLCDSFLLLDVSLETVLNKKRDVKFSEEQIKSCFGPNELGIIKKLVGEEAAPKLFYDYLTEYNRHHNHYIKNFYPGVRNLLEKLKDEYDLFIITGRNIESLFISLSKLDGFKYFKYCYGGDITGAIKNKLLIKLSNDFKIPLSEMIYIGDSVKDYYQCTDVGVKYISACYINKENIDRLEALNNNLIAKNVAELEDLINKYAK